MIGAVVLASEPPRPQSNGEQLELLSPGHLVESAMKPFLGQDLAEIVLVLGHDYHHVLNVLKDFPPHVKVVIHRKPERGETSALAVGLQALRLELSGIVIARGDQILESRVLEHLLQVFREEQVKPEASKKIVVPLYHGKRGFPWIIASDLRKTLARWEGDLTLNTFLKSHRKQVLTAAIDALVMKDK